MLSRVLETEVMETAQEACEYDSMDHQAVNQAFVGDLLAACEAAGTEVASERPGVELLDLGTGTALIPILLCNKVENMQIVAVDAAEAMIRLAAKNTLQADCNEQISLMCQDAKQLPFSDSRFTVVISNSIVHHIPKPIEVLSEMVRITKPMGVLFVRDLMRPKDEETLDHLVETYAKGATENQRRMFDDSLRAALTLQEIQNLVVTLGYPAQGVTATSDRHWTWVARKIE